MKRWEVGLTDYAKRQLTAIKDRRIQARLISSLKRLEHEPDVQGKPMRDDLIGFRSVRAVGQRYRIIYRIQGQKVKVLVVAVGIRKEGDKKDIYALAKKLARLGLLEPEEPGDSEKPQA